MTSAPTDKPSNPLRKPKALVPPGTGNTGKKEYILPSWPAMGLFSLVLDLDVLNTFQSLNDCEQFSIFPNLSSLE